MGNLPLDEMLQSLPEVERDRHAVLPGTVPVLVTSLRAAKVWKRREDGSLEADPYQAGGKFDLRPQELGSIRELARLLMEQLESRPDLLVIRGALRPEHDPLAEVRRAYLPSNRDQPSFMEAPDGRSWLMIDVDDVDCPDEIDPKANPEAAVRHVISLLPSNFHDVTCAYQWSGSFGVKGWKKLKVHLWYWLDEPVLDSDLKRWAKQFPMIDDALFNPVQVHYTAAPLFEEGVDDPFGPDSGRSRSGVIEGEHEAASIMGDIPPPPPSQLPVTGQSNPDERVDHDVPLEERIARAKTYAGKLPAAVQGEKGDEQTFKAASKIVRGFDLDDDNAFDVLNSEFNPRCQPPWSEADLRKKIASARSSGGMPFGYLLVGNIWATPGTDLWLAQLFVKAHESRLRYVGRWRRWMAWNKEGRWVEDDCGIAMRLMLDVVHREKKKAAAKHREAKTEEEEKEAKKALSIASNLMSQPRLNRALALASSLEPVQATTDQWDSDPMLLNCKNGTIDLSTGKLRPHDHRDFITKMCPVEYDPAAKVTEWVKFLRSIIPDGEVQRYVGRAMGYAITGRVKEHLLHILWGSGSNGKSTFVEALNFVLGDYARSVPSQLLLDGAAGRHPTEIASLFGVRFAFATELPENGRLNENVMKSLTGGDTINARRMREDFWQFAPTHTLMVSTNHRPRIVGNDHGVWRRLRLVPFTVQIPDDQQDHDLSDKLRKEASGILRWLVAACQSYLKNGLTPPQVVQVATNEYREAEDVFGQFVEECVVDDPEAAYVSANDVYRRYESWATMNGYRPYGQRTVSKKLKERGYKEAKRKGVRGFKGIRLTLGDSGWGEAGGPGNPEPPFVPDSVAEDALAKALGEDTEEAESMP